MPFIVCSQVGIHLFVLSSDFVDDRLCLCLKRNVYLFFTTLNRNKSYIGLALNINFAKFHSQHKIQSYIEFAPYFNQSQFSTI